MPIIEVSSQGNVPIEELSYEEAYAELEMVVQKLETNKYLLDEAISLFERGQLLSDHCSKLLDVAELKIKLLSGDILTDYRVE
jgi:exodeoxyribonuclease VII small subunit